MPKVDVKYLILRDLKLQALEVYGVDNWEGYSDACKLYENLINDQTNNIENKEK